MASKLPTAGINELSIENALRKLSDETLTGEFDEIYKLIPVTDETSCGIGFFRGRALQK